jgi:hypothetical protein
MSKGVFGVTAAIAAALLLGRASPAAAAAGNGIRVGGSEGRLHPYLGVEGRYDSNVFFDDAGRQVGDLVLHVRPGIALQVPGETTSVDLNAALDWAQYLGLEDSATRDDLSKLYGEASLGIGLNRRGSLGLELDDVFRRSTATQTFTFGSAVIANYNTLRLAVPWKPGGGALVLTAGGDWTLETFEPYLDGVDTTALSKLGYSDLSGFGELRWKFLPRTAAVLEASYFERLPSDPDLSSEASGVRAAAGMTGLVTSHLAGTLKAGYGDTLGSLDESFRTWLATAELEWLATETASVRIGYGHDFGVDPGLTTTGRALLYSTNRLSAEARVLMRSRYTLRLAGQWEHRSYELVEGTSNAVVRVEPSVDAQVARWLRAGVGYVYSRRDAERPGLTSSIPGFDYDKSEAWLRLTCTY